MLDLDYQIKEIIENSKTIFRITVLRLDNTGIKKWIIIVLSNTKTKSQGK